MPIRIRLGPYGFSFCKKVKKKFHACVPLKCIDKAKYGLSR
jgi:hypothetical protein